MQCVSLKNWTYQARPALVNINSNETLSYPFIVTSLTLLMINMPDWVCVPNKVKKVYVKVFNLTWV